MQMLQDMRDALSTTEVIFQDFTQVRKRKADNEIFCFFEGKTDYSYYGIRINLKTEKDVKPFICKNKRNVLEVYDRVKSNTKAGLEGTLFFIDRDFDENLNKEHLYETPCYSIENLYISDEVFKKVLIGEFSLSDCTCDKNEIVEYEKVVKYYRDRKTEFMNNILLLNAWYSMQRKKSKDIKDTPKPNLTKLKELKKINIDYSTHNITADYTLDYLKSITENYVEVSQAEIDQEVNRININIDMEIRGKYLVDFIAKIYGVICTDANAPNEIFSTRRVVRLNVSKDKILSELSQYAMTPSCLKIFLAESVPA